MKHFEVRITAEADADLISLSQYISEICHSPLSSRRYISGLQKEILKLRILALSFPISNSKYILKFGDSARRINYKKLAIIYTIHKNTVLVKRIIPASLIHS